MRYRVGLLVVALLISGLAGSWFVVSRAGADQPANQSFENTWARTDLPVAEGQVNRTWMWGPKAITGSQIEPYDEAVGGEREVQYFDKSRMEINDPGGDQDSIWFVTNGLLAMELITGEMQFGDQNFVQYEPAELQIAGDPYPNSPTYAQLEPLLDEPATPVGETLTKRLNPDGTISEDGSLAAHGVTAAHLEELRDHTVASPFWEFMHAEGLVHDGGQNVTEPLFVNPFYATGVPVTEAYWVNVPIAGEFVDVLTQCFERRCLTYAPDNDPNWQVEAGNIGQHYYDWRQKQLAAGPSDPVDDSDDSDIIELQPARFEASPTEANALVGDGLKITVTVFDQLDSHYEGANVSATIETGPHAQTQIQVDPPTTGSDGKATVSYVGARTGTDTIVVSVTGVDDDRSVTATWADHGDSDYIEADVEIYEEVVLTESTVIAEPSTEQLLVYAAADLTELRFSETNDQLDAIEASDILVLDRTAVTSEPIIALVNGKSMDGPAVVLQTEPGWLGDVIEDGAFTVSAAVPSASAGSSSFHSLDEVALENDDSLISWGESFNHQFGDSIEIDGDVALHGDLDFDYNFRWRRFRLEQFEAAVTTNESARIELDIDGEVSQTAQTNLFDHSLSTVVFTIGPVPVWIRNDLYVDAGVNVSTNGPVHAGFRYTGTHTRGIWYDRDQSPRYGSIRESQRDPQAIGPYVDDHAAASAWIEPGVRARFYGLVGTQFGLPVTAEFQADADLNWAIEARIETRLSLIAEIARIIEFNYDLGRRELWAAELASGSLQELTEDFSCDQVDSIPLEECESLLHLYHSTDGENWTRRTGWLMWDDPCEWHGVSCSAENSVVAIELPDSNLRTGRLDVMGLVNLRALRVLNLSGNLLFGEIPPQLENLPHLHVIKLDNNEFTGTVPSEIGNVESLEVLHVHGNPMSGGLPLQLVFLQELQQFYFHDTDLCENPDLDFQFWIRNHVDDVQTTGTVCDFEV